MEKREAWLQGLQALFSSYAARISKLLQKYPASQVIRLELGKAWFMAKKPKEASMTLAKLNAAGLSPRELIEAGRMMLSLDMASKGAALFLKKKAKDFPNEEDKIFISALLLGENLLTKAEEFISPDLEKYNDSKGLVLKIKEFEILSNALPEGLIRPFRRLLYQKLFDRFPSAPEAREKSRLIKGLSLCKGMNAPYLKGRDLEGKETASMPFKGKYLILHWWRTNSLLSKEDLETIKKLKQSYKDKGLCVLGISMDTIENNWKRLKWNDSSKGAPPWPSLWAKQGFASPLAIDYGVTSVPFSAIVDAAGRIRALGLRGERLSAKIEKLFSSPEKGQSK